MDQHEQHLLTNRLRIVGEVFKEMNNRLHLMKNLTKDQAYYMTASVFRTYAFDEKDWDNLKSHGEYMPDFLKDAKNESYKDVIKKLSDKYWNKANPTKENEAEEKAKAEKEGKSEDDGSIFEQDGHNSRSDTHHGFAMNQVSLGGGKPIIFHILPDAQLEEKVLRLTKNKNFDQAHNEVRGYIIECLEGQLTGQDLALAQTPTDIKLNKPIQFNSVGISQTFHIKNQSLVDALSSVHLGIILTKEHMLALQQEKEQLNEHKREHTRNAALSVLSGDIKGALGELNVSDEECKEAVKAGTEDLCHHIEENPYSNDIPIGLIKSTKNVAEEIHNAAPKQGPAAPQDPAVEPAAEKTLETTPQDKAPDTTKEFVKQKPEAPAGPQPGDELTPEDQQEIYELGLDPEEFTTHSAMEEFRKSDEYMNLMMNGRVRSLGLPTDDE